MISHDIVCAFRRISQTLCQCQRIALTFITPFITESSQMPSKTITDAFVRTVKPPKPRLVIDKETGKEKKTNLQVTYLDTRERGRALALTVSYGGTKAFSVLTYENGKPKFRKLGNYPAMSLKAARAAVEAYYQDPKAFEAKTAPD